MKLTQILFCLFLFSCAEEPPSPTKKKTSNTIKNIQENSLSSTSLSSLSSLSSAQECQGICRTIKGELFYRGPSGECRFVNAEHAGSMELVPLDSILTQVSHLQYCPGADAYLNKAIDTQKSQQISSIQQNSSIEGPLIQNSVSQQTSIIQQSSITQQSSIFQASSENQNTNIYYVGKFRLDNAGVIYYRNEHGQMCRYVDWIHAGIQNMIEVPIAPAPWNVSQVLICPGGHK